MKEIKSTLLEISENFKQLAKFKTSDIEKAAELIIEKIKKGGKVIFFGNGGSAADAQHLSAELVGRYKRKRKPLPSISLATDTSVITAVGNDFSFNEIFSRQIEALGNKNDVIYAISTSGKSENIINALKQAKKQGITCIGVTGKNFEKFSKFCEIIISVPSIKSDRIQEMHIAVGQIICEIIENKLC